MTRLNADTGGLLEKKVSFRLDDERFNLLDRYARKEGFSMSIIVRHMVNRFLEDRKRYMEMP
jgi:predicted DNA-binding protein